MQDEPRKSNFLTPFWMNFGRHFGGFSATFFDIFGLDLESVLTPIWYRFGVVFLHFLGAGFVGFRDNFSKFLGAIFDFFGRKFGPIWATTFGSRFDVDLPKHDARVQNHFRVGQKSGAQCWPHTARIIFRIIRIAFCVFRSISDFENPGARFA